MNEANCEMRNTLFDEDLTHNCPVSAKTIKPNSLKAHSSQRRCAPGCDRETRAGQVPSVDRNETVHRIAAALPAIRPLQTAE
jgi:hypothetical protein